MPRRSAPPENPVVPAPRDHPVTLGIVFGDQLDHASPLLSRLDRARDTILMVEAPFESRHVPSHIQRTVLFLSAMRHYAKWLEVQGFRVRYSPLTDPANTGTLGSEIKRAIAELAPKALACVHPGEWRVVQGLEAIAKSTQLPLELLEDTHFLTPPEKFADWAEGRSSLTMEFFYREQRRATGYLMEGTGKSAKPLTGVWNFDKSNRLPFGPAGPKPPPPLPVRFKPDAITRQVIADVRKHLPDLPGRLARDEDFAWPVTREQALEALRDFIAHRLHNFGPYEDAMWTNTPFVYHSVLSPALNLKLISPRECCDAAVAHFHAGKAPLESVEAFVRQLIGWREFIRGVYWLEGPAYATRNALDAHGTLPEFYWTGNTDLNCLRHAINQVLDHSFGHHIQRLMVTGNFALIAGVHPKAISDWYLGMYADGVDWVTLPNTLGMVMHADARPNSPRGVTGVVGTKPYAASGKYIDRMSNYCTGCKYDPEQRTGDRACPFTVFYWDFLVRHRERFASNQRMAMILKNVDRFDEPTRVQLTLDADLLRKRLGITRKT